MRWRMVLEEYNPELIYLPGRLNIVTDALSRLDFDDGIEDAQLNELLAFDESELPTTSYPLHYGLLQQEQRKDKLLQLQRQKTGFAVKQVRGGDKTYELIYHKDKILVPKTLQRRIVDWYHNQLCHPGINCTKRTIQQHFTWPKLHFDVERYCKTCHTCQLTKKNSKKYGKLPPKEAEATPWDILCVDLIGPYTIHRKGKTDLTLLCLTMIDPATGWFEVVETPNKQADTVANLIENNWLTRYPWPTKVISDRGGEFMAEVNAMLVNDYGIRAKRITTRNPQANALLERIHQTIGNMIRTFQVQSTDINENYPWTGILSATRFATRATVHTTTNATPMQLVFGRDVILNVKFNADWALIKERKQTMIYKNNERENAKQKTHTYEIGDEIVFESDNATKYGKNPFSGPHKILQVNDNGTLRIQRGRVINTINIRLARPYHNADP